MGTTRLIPMHQNKGKSILNTLTARIGYIKNGEKTQDGELITAFACTPETAEKQFALSKKIYKQNTGRKQKNDVIAYHLRQAFSPEDNITPELANKIGYELAEKLTHGNHAFIVSTHVDKAHIHNHIIFNSTNRDCTGKFRNFWNSYKAVRKISDLLCLKNHLSIIENPKGKGKKYQDYTQQPPTFSDILRTTIDEAIAQKPVDFEEFLRHMTKEGYIIKKGKHLAFKGGGQKKFIRLRSLGENYSEENLRAVIDGGKQHTPSPKKNQKPKEEKEEPLGLLIDLQSEMVNEKGAGYKRWAKRFNTKQMARTMTYLSENNLMDYKELCKKVKEVLGDYNDFSAEYREVEKKLTEISLLQKMIVQYARTKDTQKAYQKSGYSPDFKEANIENILLHEGAKKFFKEQGITKLPKMADLKIEYADLLAEKKKLYSKQNFTDKERKEILNAKANVEAILGKELEQYQEPQSPEEEKEKRKEQQR